MATEEEAVSPLREAWGIFGPSHVPYRVLLLSRMLDRLTTRHVRNLADLSLAEWRVVAHLAVMGRTSASRLSSAALVDQAEISRAVKALTAKELITRHPNPADKRSALLGLTDEGQAVYDKTHKERRRFFATLTKDFEVSELEQLDDYIYRIAQVADRLILEGMDNLD